MPAHTTTPKKATTHSHYFTLPPNHGRCPPPSSLGDKRIKICYKDDGDSGKVWRRCRGIRGAGDERQRQCAAVAIAQLMAAAREAVDDGAGAIVPFFEKGGAGGSGTHHVVPEGIDAACRSKMVPWASERAERARRRWGGEENGGEAASIPSLVGWWQHWTTRMRMKVVAGGTKQQPTP